MKRFGIDFTLNIPVLLSLGAIVWMGGRYSARVEMLEASIMVIEQKLAANTADHTAIMATVTKTAALLDSRVIIKPSP